MLSPLLCLNQYKGHNMIARPRIQASYINGTLNIESWLQQVAGSIQVADIDFLRHACALAQLMHEEYFCQGLSMADILVDLGLDSETLAAAIVYGSFQYSDLDLADISQQLGEKVAKLVKGTMQMSILRSLQKKNTTEQMDKIRHMILAMVDDIRVVIIKLSEAVTILQGAATLDPESRRLIAQETMDIYAPLANRLGIGQLKWQLEDLAFRYLQPDEYKHLSKALNERREDRERYVQQVLAEIRTLLEKDGIIGAEVSGRAKHIYSIYRKMISKKVDFNEVYDVIALRILVPTIGDCYAALSSVQTWLPPVAKEFNDYIAAPKANGYASIHTAVVGPRDRHIEIQIRTYDMHKAAEFGVAAHWRYKEGKIKWLRQVMDWQKELNTPLLDNRVYVFTPNGQIKDFTKGSTPLDFAYAIHTEIGHRCRGSKVNGRIVPLTYSLCMGDRVEILTTKTGHPSRDWLNPQLGYLHSSNARAKVHHWFRLQDYSKNLAQGQDILERELRRLNLKQVAHNHLATMLHYKTSDDFYAALGRGDLRIAHVIRCLQNEDATPAPETKPLPVPDHYQDTSAIVIEGVGNLLTSLARCCKPAPGDPVKGYVTQGRGISVHKQGCSNILRAEKRKKERILDVNWRVLSS